MVQTIEELRITLAKGICSGRVRLGPIPSIQKDQHVPFRSHPTASIYDIASLADVVVVDNRCLNNQIGVPIATSWDLINSMFAKGHLDFETLLDRRTNHRSHHLIGKATGGAIQ